jgi:hypothetical protein
MRTEAAIVSHAAKIRDDFWEVPLHDNVLPEVERVPGTRPGMTSSISPNQTR